MRNIYPWVCNYFKIAGLPFLNQLIGLHLIEFWWFKAIFLEKTQYWNKKSHFWTLILRFLPPETPARVCFIEGNDLKPSCLQSQHEKPNANVHPSIVRQLETSSWILPMWPELCRDVQYGNGTTYLFQYTAQI